MRRPCLLVPLLAILVGCSPPKERTPPAAAGTLVSLFVGGEKSEFLANPEVLRLLEERHGLRLDAVKAGSVEMVRGLDSSGKDALWPSTDLAVEYFRIAGGRSQHTDILFNSPIVVYTGWDIAAALVREGYVEKRGDTYFIVRFPELLEDIRTGKSWRDLGLGFYGNLNIRSSDPTKSNSGNMYLGLVANLFNNGQVLRPEDLERVGPLVRDLFARQGMMEHSSGDVFRKFIATGLRNSMVVGYENQIVEFVLAHPESRDAILQSVCVLYPQPTVWSSHPMIALTPNGRRLLEALRDPEIQEIAFRRHGFRTALAGIGQDPATLGVPGLARSIEQVMPLPGAVAMENLMRLLEGRETLSQPPARP
jgi:hypothetical protein